MNFITAAAVAAFGISTVGATHSPVNAAPLPTNVAAMKISADEPLLHVRYGRWGGGYRGWGGGYRGWGYRGYRGWRGVAAGAVVGGAIARSTYYGDGYPYYGDGDSYGDGYAYSGGYTSDDCPPHAYYSRYGAGRYYYGW
jgi:hypothetical protein